MPAPAVSAVLLSLRLPDYDTISMYGHAIDEAAILEDVHRSASVARDKRLKRALVDADLPSVFKAGFSRVPVGSGAFLSSELPSRELFPLRAYFAPQLGFSIKPHGDWLAARGGRGRSPINDDMPFFDLQLPLRHVPSSEEEKRRRCLLKAHDRRRKEQTGFRRRVTVLAYPRQFFGSMTADWLIGYAFALSGHGGHGADVRYGELGKPVSIHFGKPSAEQALSYGGGYFALLIAKSPSTIALANQLREQPSNGPRYLPNGKRRRQPGSPQLSLLSEQPF